MDPKSGEKGGKSSRMIVRKLNHHFPSGFRSSPKAVQITTNNTIAITATLPRRRQKSVQNMHENMKERLSLLNKMRVFVFLCLLMVSIQAFTSRTTTHSIRYNTKGVSTGICMMGKGFGAVKKPEFKYTGSIVPGIIGPKLLVPSTIGRPDYAADGIPKHQNRGMPWDVSPQTPEDIARMRVSGRIAREVLDAAVRFVKAGVTTAEIDQLVHDETTKRNSYPSPLNYHGFPKSCCTSINEIICHGIPDSTVVNEGDIINIDVTIFHDGVHGDCSETGDMSSIASTYTYL